MHDPTARTHPPVKALVLPPHEACDFVYYEQRLADLHLLDRAISICTLRLSFLAVPVGGSRRGGFFPVDCACFGLAVRYALRAFPGFPDVRLRWSPWPDPHHVEWGEKPSWLWSCQDDAVLGRFYGYSDAAIARYTAAKTRAPQVPPPDACGPLRRSSVGVASSWAVPATFERKSRHV
ncbi:DUF6302 family protein [Streptomyces sp. NPDC020607]|uniref:DUF6302 family protein n=1 Tax=Streptomyces sp. NPDC020607 TaxID=3365082 RepID=UPI0037B5C6BA